MAKSRKRSKQTSKWMKSFRYVWASVTSKAFWSYAVFSRAGGASFLAVFGGINLFIGSLDFFNVYTRDEYAPYAIWIFVVVSVLVSVFLFRRPVTSVEIKLPTRDVHIEVKIGDLFEETGAVVISSNTVFESDVANGKIAEDSLQGQFTKEYFPGDQSELIDKIQAQLDQMELDAPYPMGTVVPINTHGKDFYFTAMAELNEKGNAKSTVRDVKDALNGLWAYVRDSGELQELAIPVMGTGRGRVVRRDRKRMIQTISESFVDGSKEGKVSDKLVIVIRPEDAQKFQVNLWEIKDYLDNAFAA